MIIPRFCVVGFYKKVDNLQSKIDKNKQKFSFGNKVKNMNDLENKFEKEFKNFCKNRGWKIYKIPELPDICMPDFFVVANNNPFIVEVKGLSESGPERSDIEKMEINGEIVGQSGDYNKEIDSIVRKIDEASGQFKSTTSFNVPQILVIYSERSFVFFNKDILFQAMYGKIFQRLRISPLKKISKDVPKSLPPLIIDKTLRKNKNNLISAIVIPNSKNGVFVLHNLWTTIPLPVSIFNKENDKNYIPSEIKFKLKVHKDKKF